jgi:class 3 adenylate cyclase/tetratricopeptide (TPR) repeat protein
VTVEGRTLAVEHPRAQITKDKLLKKSTGQPSVGTGRALIGMTDIAAWLEEIGLQKYTEAFRSNDIDFDVLPALGPDELKELGVSLGDRQRLLKAIAARSGTPAETSASGVRATSATVAPAPAAPPQPAPLPEPSEERRQLTVLFADLVGSTALSQALDAEDLRDVLRGYQNTVTAAIRDAGGFVAKFMGDGVLVYFGYPHASENAAERAVTASLRAIAAVQALPAIDGQSLATRIGIATGPVVVGEVIGESLAREVNVVGETPNLAARLQGLAAPNSAVLSDVTARMVADSFVLDDLGLHDLKGIALPARVFAAVRERTAAEREAAAEAAGAALLVGRDAELALLMERWSQSKDGRGQAALVTGEGGIGKSQLVNILRSRVSREGFTRIAFRCSPHQKSSAFLPVITHLDQLLQFRGDDTPEDKFSKLERVLSAYNFPRADTVPLFATLLSVPLPENVPPSYLTPEQQKQHTQHDLVAWLTEEAEKQPLLAVWEDVQWIDPSSLELLELLLDQIPTVPVMMVMTCRPEFRSPWGIRSHLTPIMLGNLGRAHVETIATHTAGGKMLPAALVAQIAEKTDGVPLFVEETTKALIESGALRDAGDHYELTGPIEALSIPISLNDALMARLDRLPAAKSVAQLGAVIGRRFSYDLIRTVAAFDEGRLQQELGQLVSAELLHQRGMVPRTTYMFKQALIQDVAYESLLRRRREVLHGAIGEAIEALEGASAGEQAATLAYHYARSLHHDRAVKYSLLAGDQAMRLHAPAEAAISYDQALTLARGLPDTPVARRLQIDATLKLAATGRSREDLARDQANLAQAQAMAEALADEPSLARVLYWQGRIAYVRGNFADALPLAEQSLAIADRLADETLSAPPANLLGRISVMRWDVARASQLLARSAEQMHQIGNRVEEATATGLVAISFAYHGEPAQALAYGERALALARELTDPFAEAAALQFRGVMHDQQGAWTEATANFGAARRVAGTAGDQFRVYIVNLLDGWALSKAGDPAAGRALVEQGLRFAEKIGTAFMLGLGKAFLAACAVALGDGAATALCRDALAEKTSDRFAHAVAYRALAEALAGDRAAPDRAQAEEAIAQSIRLSEEIGFNPERARTYLSYARLLQGWGEDSQAKSYLTQAIAMFREMEMAWDLARAEQMLMPEEQ